MLSINDLPKIGRAGINPMAIIDIINSRGELMFGGEREKRCKSSMTKVYRNSLDCEVNTKFVFPIETKDVRSNLTLRCRVIDHQRPPIDSRPIGFMEYPLFELARQHGGILAARSFALRALVDFQASGGREYKFGEQLQSYRNATQTSVMMLSLDMPEPPYTLPGTL